MNVPHSAWIRREGVGHPVSPGLVAPRLFELRTLRVTYPRGGFAQKLPLSQ
jgi:hypothetical protein